ncbi:hypothetical protein [Streptomyces sp. NBC_00145]
MLSVTSRLQDPAQRSAHAFILGTPGRMDATLAPMEVKTASKPSLK